MRLKLDIGAQGNTLPIRTFKQMYGEADPKKVLEPIGRTRLTSYSGDNIKCIGKLSVWCKYGTTKWKRVMFYVVDVPGPIVLGLPMCEALDLVTINCHVEALVAKPLPGPRIKSVDDLRMLYPEQFDTIGKFKEPARIILKPDAVPHVDRPHTCNISLKPRIEAELKRMTDLGVIRKVREHTCNISIIVLSQVDAVHSHQSRFCMYP